VLNNYRVSCKSLNSRLNKIIAFVCIYNFDELYPSLLVLDSDRWPFVGVLPLIPSRIRGFVFSGTYSERRR
jgi:hypothetical protein